MGKTSPAVAVCGIVCYVPIGIIIGSLIVAEHNRQAKLPTAMCDFRGGIAHTEISWYSSKNGHYETWTVNGTANYTYGNNQYIILQVNGMYPAPRQPLNRANQEDATNKLKQVNESLTPCTLERDSPNTPNSNIVYTAYPELISATTGIVMIVFVFVGICVGCIIVLCRDDPPVATTEPHVATPRDPAPVEMTGHNPHPTTTQDIEEPPPTYDNPIKDIEEPPPAYDRNQSVDIPEPSQLRNQSQDTNTGD